MIVAVIDYFAVAAMNFPKEFLEVHFDGKASLWTITREFRLRVKVAAIQSSCPEGHPEDGSRWPIPCPRIPPGDLIAGDAEATEINFLVNNF